MRWATLEVACAVAALFVLSGCHVYWGEEIAGRVVDGQTGEPVSMATVVVVWNLYGGSVHGNTNGPWRISENVTDAEGNFRLSAWGPSIVFWDGLHVASPTLIVAHADYYFEIATHPYPTNRHVPPTFSIESRSCECGEKRISVTRADSDLKRYRENAEIASRNLPLRPGRPGLACARTEAPNFTRELLKRSSILTVEGIEHALPMSSC